MEAYGGQSPAVAAPPRVALVTSTTYLQHDTGYHPENAGRLGAVYHDLHQANLHGLLPYMPRLEPRPAMDEELLAVHTPDHLRHLRALAERGGGVTDGDTVVAAQSEQVARLAAGGALVALDAVVAGGPDKPSAAFVLARPPGHHAMAARAMGFCLYNSIAVAARYAQ